MKTAWKVLVTVAVAVLVYLGSMTSADALVRCPNGQVVSTLSLCGSGGTALLGSAGNPTWNDAATLFDAILAGMSAPTQIGGVQYLAITGFDASAITELQSYFGVLAGSVPTSQQATLLTQTFSSGNLNTLHSLGLTMNLDFAAISNVNLGNANVNNPSFFSYTFTSPNTDTPSVPEPSTVILLGAGLAGLVGYRIRAKARQN